MRQDVDFRVEQHQRGWIRSGSRAASSSMSRPPNECPTQSACSMPSASTVSIRSAMWGRKFHGGS